MSGELIVLDDSYLPKIGALFKKVFEGEPWNDDWSDETQLTEYMKEITYAYRPLNYGLMIGEKLCAVSIGHIKHFWMGTEYYLDELFVDPECQGQGAGSLFLDLIEKDIKAKGLCGIFLQTENDKPAYDFYIHRGFKELPGHVSFFKEV